MKDLLRERWGEILKLPCDDSSISYRANDLVDSVELAFAAERPGWPGARYHSPDLMFIDEPKEGCAPSIVLGEVHAAVNTCGIRVYQSQVENSEEMIAARAHDLSDPAVVPVIPREQASRADHVCMSSRDFDLESGDTPSWKERSKVLEVGALVLTERSGELIVRDRGSGREFFLVEILEAALSAEVVADFSYLPISAHSAHRPRISIGGLIVGRETWHFESAEIPFAESPRGVEQFVEARRWAEEYGLPPRVFVKTPEETKPVYIDLTSPVYVEIFVRLARQASTLMVSEMLPEIGQQWLRDQEGSQFTSEVRIVAVDPVPWREAT
ncbi:MAG: hypothetical protein GY811_09190 [Myxococcales bacterium]|nr:hypothetical protein [Myxococcales bacterium]